MGRDSFPNLSHLGNHSDLLFCPLPCLVGHYLPSHIFLNHVDSGYSPPFIYIRRSINFLAFGLVPSFRDLDCYIGHGRHLNLAGHWFDNYFSVHHLLCDESGVWGHFWEFFYDCNFSRHLDGLDHDLLYNEWHFFPHSLLDGTLTIFRVHVTVLMLVMVVMVVWIHRLIAVRTTAAATPSVFATLSTATGFRLLWRNFDSTLAPRA